MIILMTSKPKVDAAARENANQLLKPGEPLQIAPITTHKTTGAQMSNIIPRSNVKYSEITIVDADKPGVIGVIGGRSAIQIAEELNTSYDDKSLLKKIYLMVEDDQFNQELTKELSKLGFSNVTVYSVNSEVGELNKNNYKSLLDTSIQNLDSQTESTTSNSNKSLNSTDSGSSDGNSNSGSVKESRTIGNILDTTKRIMTNSLIPNERELQAKIAAANTQLAIIDDKETAYLNLIKNDLETKYKSYLLTSRPEILNILHKYAQAEPSNRISLWDELKRSLSSSVTTDTKILAIKNGLEQIYTTTVANKTKTSLLDEITEADQAIRTALALRITNYGIKHAHEINEGTHPQKQAVLNQITLFLNKKCDWAEVKTSASQNVGWKTGVTSEVRQIYDSAERLLTPKQANTSSASFSVSSMTQKINPAALFRSLIRSEPSKNPNADEDTTLTSKKP